MPKYTHTHKTEGGVARIICTDRVTTAARIYVVLHIPSYADHEDMLAYTQEEFETEFKELPPWHACKIDDPVYVREFGVPTWVKRHFAGLASNDYPMFWWYGCTSFTAKKCGVAHECYPVDQAPEHVIQQVISQS